MNLGIGWILQRGIRQVHLKELKKMGQPSSRHCDAVSLQIRPSEDVAPEFGHSCYHSKIALQFVVISNFVIKKL